MEAQFKESSLKDLIFQANQYIEDKTGGLSLSDRVKASRKGKRIVLAINGFYKKSKNPDLMAIMKAVTEKKRRVEKRLKMRPSTEV